ncbi:MAG: hypothetical protein JWN43_3080 [Gammaproteobacteria bacterium]|nr:hypothetical protein [Gammaproteobacteria bacterium]
MIALAILFALIVIAVLAIAHKIPDKTWSFKLVFALDLFGCAVIFQVSGLSISTLSGLVRDGKDAPFRLSPWQRSFLRWLEPRLSRAHVEGALAYDRANARFILDNTPGSP